MTILDDTCIWYKRVPCNSINLQHIFLCILPKNFKNIFKISYWLIFFCIKNIRICWTYISIKKPSKKKTILMSCHLFRCWVENFLAPTHIKIYLFALDYACAYICFRLCMCIYIPWIVHTHIFSLDSAYVFKIIVKIKNNICFILSFSCQKQDNRNEEQEFLIFFKVQYLNIDFELLQCYTKSR